jgi:adenosylcobinamide kinase/adenosylcobinamide-phosphate guanylyltransferase
MTRVCRVTLVTGGGRSGKSDYAVREAMRCEGRRVFIATAEPFDAEMRARIEAHRRDRAGQFETIEAPVRLAEAVGGLEAGVGVAVVDCLTVWLGNLMHYHGGGGGMQTEVDALLAVLESPPCELVLVTNEVGLGIIPENAMAREFRDLAGRLNRRVAERAGRVVMLISGIPLYLKGAS